MAHILIVTDYLPYPPISGDRIRVYHLAKRLAQKHQVSFAAPVRNEEEAQSVNVLGQFCKHILTAEIHQKSPLAHLPGLVATALHGLPLELHFLTSQDLMKQIAALMVQDPADIVQFEHSRMAHYRRALPTSSTAKTVLTFHNAASQQYETIYKVTRALVPKFRAWLFSRQMRAWEAKCVNTFDLNLAVSTLDRDLLLRDAPHGRMEVLANGVDTHACPLLPKPNTPPALILIGLMSYAPYTDSAIYFCKEILPIIRAAIGEVQVFIVGPNPPEEVKRLAGNGVHVTGRVPEVQPYYQQATVSVVPLRAGGGTRLKILEAMSLGRPVVSTSLGCEGLNVEAEKHLLVADDPQTFAQAVLRLLSDPLLYERITTQARARVEEQYDWDVLTQQLLTLYDQLLQE